MERTPDDKPLAFRKSLATRHAALTVLVALVVGLGLSLTELVLNLREERTRLNDSIRLILDTVSVPAAAAAYAMDDALARDIAIRLVQHPAILSVEIKDDLGRILGQAFRTQKTRSPGGPLGRLVEPGDPIVLRLARDAVSTDPDYVGRLIVTVDQNVIFKEISDSVLKTFIYGIIRAVSISLIIAALLYVFISRPLLRLAGAVAGVDPNAPGQPPITTARQHEEDELGVIARAVNRLVQAFRESLTERDRIGQDLRTLADTLEQKVEERTAELAQSNENLRMAMDHLVSTEKLASLGQLVAGVAHELNTPIGNMVTVSSTLEGRVEAFGAAVEAGAIRRSVLDAFLTETLEASRLLKRVSQTAAQLVGSFKQVAADQGSFGQREFDLEETVRETLSSLRNTLKSSPVRIDLDIPAGLVLDNRPGPIEQILTNLILNSLCHAFDEEEAGTIRIAARLKGDRVILDYRDNGCGMDAETARRAFEPFFTTKFGQGGTGLGLYILYNLVTSILSGAIQLETSPKKGVHFRIIFPATASPQDPTPRRSS